MVKNPEHNEVVRARLEAFLLALADTYPESREYVKEVWRRIEQSQPVPEGVVLVPMEPTEEMLKAADESDREYTMRNFGTRHPVIQGGAYDHYIAMLAAAPKQPQPVPEVGAMADVLGDALRSKHSVFLTHTTLVDLVRAMLAAAPNPGGE